MSIAGTENPLTPTFRALLLEEEKGVVEIRKVSDSGELGEELALDEIMLVGELRRLEPVELAEKALSVESMKD